MPTKTHYFWNVELNKTQVKKWSRYVLRVNGCTWVECAHEDHSVIIRCKN